jgi:hypothetical protein
MNGESFRMETEFAPLTLAFTLLFSGLVSLLIAYSERKKIINLHHYIVVDNISGAPIGLPCVLRGTVSSANNPLIAPASKKNVIYYKTLTFNNVSANEDRGPIWSLSESPDVGIIDFKIKDNSEEMYVNTHKALYFLDANPQAIYSESKIRDQSKYKFLESAIAEGDSLNVYGVISVQGNDNIISESDEYPLIVSTFSRDQIFKKTIFYYKSSLWIGMLIIGIALYLALETLHLI